MKILGSRRECFPQLRLQATFKTKNHGRRLHILNDLLLVIFAFATPLWVGCTQPTEESDREVRLPSESEKARQKLGAAGTELALAWSPRSKINLWNRLNSTVAEIEWSEARERLFQFDAKENIKNVQKLTEVLLCDAELDPCPFAETLVLRTEELDTPLKVFAALNVPLTQNSNAFLEHIKSICAVHSAVWRLGVPLEAAQSLICTDRQLEALEVDHDHGGNSASDAARQNAADLFAEAASIVAIMQTILANARLRLRREFVSLTDLTRPEVSAFGQTVRHAMIVTSRAVNPIPACSFNAIGNAWSGLMVHVAPTAPFPGRVSIERDLKTLEDACTIIRQNVDKTR